MRALKDNVKDFLTPAAILLMAGVMLYDHLKSPAPPAPNPAINGEALGRAYSKVLTSSYSDAWLAAAKALEDGKTIADAQKVLQDAWKDSRVKAFRAEVQPGFAVILPEGTEPTNAAKRSEVAGLWRAFAQGLKAGR
jgi:hypothetical protein